MSESLRNLVPNIDLSIKGKKVAIILRCSDEYAAQVMFDDICEKIQSEHGLCLRLRGGVKAAGALKPGAA